MSLWQRRLAQRWGRHSEALAAWVLRFKGYRILARQYRVPVGEIDIIARRGRLVAMIEVKARADWRDAAAAISPRQRRRIANAARAFLAAHPDVAAHAIRFDVMLVAPWRWPRHWPGAWIEEVPGSNGRLME
ncbi:MAG TPA: YraN family protein [Stellaceae bacterium]|nr:YraN family protein [Stellaceae bacterium]